MTRLKTTKSHQQQPSHSNYMTQEMDVSLVDLWILIRRYKKRFMLIFSFVLLSGLLYAYFAHTETYSLVSTIQIGTREKDDSILPIESPESLLSKIDNSIIPSYTSMWNQQNDFIGTIETKSSNPNNSNIILLTNKIANDDIDFLSEFQKGLVKIIIDDNKRMLNSMKSKVESRLRLAQVELDNLKNPITLENKLKAAQIELDDQAIELKKIEDEKFFGVKKAEFQNEILQAKHEKKQLVELEKVRFEQYNRIEESKRILLEKINDLKIQISDATKNLRAAATVATEQSAMSQLLIANEIQQTQKRLAEFEERYHIKLENEKTELLQEIDTIRLKQIESQKQIDLLVAKYKVMLEDNQISRDRQKLKVSEAELKLAEIKQQHEISTALQEEKVRELKMSLDNFNDTRAVSTAVRSLKPIGAGRLQLIMLVFFVAVFFGFAAVLLAIFGDKVKERLEEEPMA